MTDPARTLVLASILLFSVAFGQNNTTPPCPTSDNSVSLEIAGLGTVIAENLEYDNETATLENACLELQSWRITMPRLQASGENAHAENLTVAALGANGTVGTLEVVAGRVTLRDVNLALAPSFDLLGLPRGDYKLRIGEMRTNGTQTEATTMQLDKLENGAVTTRYQAKTLQLRGENTNAQGVLWATKTFALHSENASLDNGQVVLHNPQAVLGRNANSQELSAQATQASVPTNTQTNTQTNTPNATLEGATFQTFGLHFPTLPTLELNPHNLERVRLDVGAGVYGLDAWRIAPNTTITAYVYDLYNAPNAALHVLASRDDTTFFLGQLEDTFGLRTRLLRNPNTGALLALEFDTGLRVLGATTHGAHQELRFGLAHSIADVSGIAGLSGRATLELGESWQATKANNARPQDITQGFVRGTLAAQGAWQFDNIGIQANAAAVLYVYDNGQPYATTSANITASYTDPLLQISGHAQTNQEWGVTQNRFHATTPHTLLEANATITPTLPNPDLFYNGIAAQEPRFGLRLRYDAQHNTWLEGSAHAQIGIAFYDGTVLQNHFGETYQTPSFMLTPRIYHDFLRGPTQYTEFGILTTFYTESLALNVGTYATITWNNTATWGAAFTFGVTLR